MLVVVVFKRSNRTEHVLNSPSTRPRQHSISIFNVKFVRYSLKYFQEIVCLRHFKSMDVNPSQLILRYRLDKEQGKYKREK